jgi:hypothetical protein
MRSTLLLDADDVELTFPGQSSRSPDLSSPRE